MHEDSSSKFKTLKLTVHVRVEDKGIVHHRSTYNCLELSPDLSLSLSLHICMFLLLQLPHSWLFCGWCHHWTWTGIAFLMLLLGHHYVSRLLCFMRFIWISWKEVVTVGLRYSFYFHYKKKIHTVKNNQFLFAANVILHYFLFSTANAYIYIYIFV